MTSELAALSRRFMQLPPDRRKAFAARLQAEGMGPATLPIVPRDPAAPVPLALAQRALWVAWQRAPQSPAYNLAGRLRITGPCDAARVQAAVRALVARHAVLRTRYALGADGQALQQVQPEPVFCWSERVWGAQGASAVHAEAPAFAALPFDLEAGPVMRAALHTLDRQACVLFIAVHHIAADGAAVALLLDELVAALAGPPRRLEPAVLQYADHALWQQHWLEAGELDRQRAYWRHRLHGALPATALPLDRPRRAARSARGELIAFDLPGDVSAALLALAARQRASPTMATLALLNLLLWRCGGDTDLSIGVPCDNRHRPELAAMVGHFTNVLVLRVQLAPQADFTALLAQVRDHLLEAQRHADVPLDLLADDLAVQRSPGLHPLFQVKCAQQAAGRAATPPGGGLQIEAQAIAVDELHFDLSLDVIEGGATLAYQLAGATDLFDAATLARLAEAFQHLARQVAAQPQQPLARFTLPGAPHLLHGEPRTWPAHSVLTLFEGHAARQPGAPALVDGEVLRSYGELHHAARRWAVRLAALGITAESRVALHFERSAGFVLAMLAALQAGAAVVPLDPAAPPERLRALLADAGAQLLLAPAPLAWAPGVPVQAVGFDPLSGDAAPAPPTARPAPPHPHQAAYVIYTSGSTGAPKGVVVSHAALANYAQALLARLALPAGLRFAMASTVAADLGHTVLFGALCAGGSLLPMAPAQAFDPDAFAHRMAACRIDVLKIVPSHLRGLLNAAQPHDVLPAHTLVLGGEVADAALLATVRRLRPGLRIVNHYGPTETTVGVLMQAEALPAGDAAPAGDLPLGRPIANMSACVLGDDLMPVPPGMPGELYVGGPGVARGYRGRAGLTAERFVASPWVPGERLYRTGDRVRLRSDGALAFLGRSDDQVKIRGFRVEPGELQGWLRARPELADAAVVAEAAEPGENGEPGGHVLRAYVVPRAGAAIDGEALRAALQHGLPAHLLPEAIVPLAALPLTANGKLDRQALPRPTAAAPPRAGEAPQGPTEQALARLWQELLGVGPVHRDDDFFALGGDSILSLKLIARLRRQVPGGAGLALAELMQATTPRSLAHRLQHRLAQQHDALCLQPAGDGTPLYCLPGMVVNSREFLPLAQALGPARPVYGFVSHVYTAQRWRGFAVEALAAEYAAFIAATATRGRCALLGWSSGGDLAYEVARQLQGRVAVGFLGLVDVFETEPLAGPQRQPAISGESQQHAQAAIGNWLSRSSMAPQWQALLARMDDDERASLAGHLAASGQALPLDGAVDDAAEFLLWATLDKRVQAPRYRYPPIATPVHVFHAQASLHAPGTLRMWEGCAPVASTTVVPATDHLSIIRSPALWAGVQRGLEAADRH